MAQPFFLTFIVIGALLCSAYFLLIGSYCYGWLNTKTFNGAAAEPVFISVIVPARNEENTIIHCLNALINQKYPAQKFEIIVVDDVSEDTTNNKILGFCENYATISLITLTEKEGGKKNAIRIAVEAAKGELIVTTDADCIMGPGWLNTIAAFYSHTQAKMIVAPVSFYDEKTVFEKMQSLEFIALMASSAGSLSFNKAIMCNGANLAYTKQVFREVNGFEDIDTISSGDDVLLMYKVKRLYPKGVFFLKNQDAIVYTKAKTGIKEFIAQRSRWASKSFQSVNAETKYVSLIVYLFNLFLLILPFVFVCLSNTSFRLTFLKIGLIIIVIKALIDFLLLFLASSFFKKRHLLFYFLPEQFLYSIYVVLTGFLGSKGKFKWKDRNIN